MTAPQTSRASSWVWLLALYTFASLIETIFYSQLIAFTPLYLPVLGVPQADVLPLVGLITALSNAVGLPFLPVWGALADRYSRKPMIIRTFVILLLAAILSLLARSVWLFVFARAITSFALGNSGLMLTTLSERVPEKRIGFAFSIMNSAAPIGAFLGPLIGGPVVDRWGLPTLLISDGVALLVVVLALAFGYKDTFQGKDQGPILKMALGSLGIIWRSLRLRLLFPALFLLFGGWMLAFTYLPLAVTALYSGANPNTAIGVVLGAGGLTTLILGPALGALADRYGHWRVLFIGAAASALLWPLPYFIPDLTGFGVAWAVLNGVVSSVFALSFAVLSSSAASATRGRIMSMAYMPVNIGFMVGPAIGAFVTRSSVFNIFPTAFVLTVLGIVTLYFSYRQGVEQELEPSGVAIPPEPV
jgi:MFS family permease